MRSAARARLVGMHGACAACVELSQSREPNQRRCGRGGRVMEGEGRWRRFGDGGLCGTSRKKARDRRGLFDETIVPASALRELEGAAGLGAAVLLALDDAGVAGEEAFLL